MTIRSVLLGLAISSLPFGAGAEAPGEILAATCYTCHGAAGKSPGAIPSIAGMGAADMHAHLAAFRDDSDTTATIMPRITRGFTDTEIDALVDYLTGSN